ncbi:MAG: MFS transporter [Candidatus Bathyarchaeia archaeon]
MDFWRGPIFLHLACICHGARGNWNGDRFSVFIYVSCIYTLSVLLGGFLADRFDRKKLIIYIFMFGSFSSLIYSFATEWWHLVPAMLVYSLATIGGPAEDSYIAALTSKERMARAFTFTEMGYSFGLIFLPF